MATSTTRVSLTKPDSGDTTVIRTDFNNNMDLIDAAVGATVVTSSTRPSSSYSGKLIEETDTSALVVRENASWKYMSVPVASTMTSVTPTHSGQLGVQTSDTTIKVSSGSTWVSPVNQSTAELATYLTASTQSCANNTDTYIDFNGTAEFTSTYVTKTTSTGSVFTFNKAGVYAITAQCKWASSTSGRRSIEIVDAANSNNRWGSNAVACSTNPEGVPHVTVYRRFAVNDAVKVLVNQNSGGALNIQIETWGTRPRVSFVYLGA